MRSKLRTLAVAGVIGSGVLLGHHGTSVTYQVDQTITLTGTVTEFAFSYPHPQLYFDVKTPNGVEHWASEFAPTPLMMKTANSIWNRSTIKPGDIVTISCNPHKAVGANVCLVRDLVVNGKRLQIGSPSPAQLGD
jgi:hypothetical protein